jgi:CHASE2 domain-containing sensor protein
VKSLPPTYKKYIIILSLSLAGFSVLFISIMLKGLIASILDQVDNTFHAQFLYVRERFNEDKEPINSDVVVVGIDDRTLNKLGAYNPTEYRRYHIDLLANILKGKPAGVAYDILFGDPHPDPDVDRRLADTMRQGPVFSVFFGAAQDRSDGVFSSYGYDLPEDVPMAYVTEAGFERMSLPVLDGLTSIGLANAYPDTDGLIRKMPMFFRVEDKLYPTIALEVFRNVKGIPRDDIRVEKGRVLVGETVVPVDKNCRAYVNIDESYKIREIPFYDVWKGRVPPRFFKDKIVFIAATATGLSDNKLVALYGYISGVLIHANLYLNLNYRNLIHEIAGNAYYFLVFMASFFYTFIFYSRSEDSTLRKIINLLSRLAAARRLGETLLSLAVVERMIQAFKRARERHYGLRLFFLLFTEARKIVEPLLLHLVLLYSTLSLVFYFFHIFVRPSAIIIQLFIAYIIVEQVRKIDFSAISTATQGVGNEPE